jgi:hypothetical protein
MLPPLPARPLMGSYSTFRQQLACYIFSIRQRISHASGSRSKRRGANSSQRRAEPLGWGREALHAGRMTSQLRRNTFREPPECGLVFDVAGLVLGAFGAKIRIKRATLFNPIPVTWTIFFIRVGDGSCTFTRVRKGLFFRIERAFSPHYRGAWFFWALKKEIVGTEVSVTQ